MVRIRKLLRSVMESAVGFKKRQCNWIIYCGLHTILFEKRCQLITTGMLDRIKMVNVGTITSNVGDLNVFNLIEAGIVDRSSALARPRPLRKMNKFGR